MGPNTSTALRTALLVATALVLSTPLALAQDANRSGGSPERFGQMKTSEGHRQAGDMAPSMSGPGRDDSSKWRGRDQDDTASSDDDDDDNDMDVGSSPVSHDGGWDRGRGDRWHSWSRDDRGRNPRGDMRQGSSEDPHDAMRDRMRERRQGRGGVGMGGMAMGGMMGMHPPVGAAFNVQVGDARVTVRCGLREDTSACVDAAVSLVNRLRQGTSSSSSTQSPSTGSGSANPAPAPSTTNPTSP